MLMTLLLFSDISYFISDFFSYSFIEYLNVAIHQGLTFYPLWFSFHIIYLNDLIYQKVLTTIYVLPTMYKYNSLLQLRLELLVNGE